MINFIVIFFFIYSIIIIVTIENKPNSSDIIYYDLTNAPAQLDLLSYMLSLPPNILTGSTELIEILWSEHPVVRQNVSHVINKLIERGLPFESIGNVGFFLERPMLEEFFEHFDESIKYARDSKYLSIDNQRVFLTNTEQRVFDFFMMRENRNRFIKKEEMIEAFGISNTEASIIQLGVLVKIVRNKLGKNGPRFILLGQGEFIFRDFKDEDSTIHASTFSYNPKIKVVEKEDSEPSVLSPIMSSMLEFFIQNQNRSISMAEIENAVWHIQGKLSPEPQIIWNYIKRLRNYIEADPKNPQHLKSRRGNAGGYTFSIKV